MNVLLVYATNSSGTQAVSEIIGQAMRQAGHRVVTKRAYEPGANDFIHYDLVILGSCTWERFDGKVRLEGQLQQHMYALVQQLQGHTFRQQKFAVFGLGDSSYTSFCAAADHLEKFVQHLGGTTLVPTLRIDSYFFDLIENRRRAEDWAQKLAIETSHK